MCDANCYDCELEVTRCTVCYGSMYLHTDHTCYDCSTYGLGCIECFATGCLRCDDGYFLHGDACTEAGLETSSEKGQITPSGSQPETLVALSDVTSEELLHISSTTATLRSDFTNVEAMLSRNNAAALEHHHELINVMRGSGSRGCTDEFTLESGYTASEVAVPIQGIADADACREECLRVEVCYGYDWFLFAEECWIYDRAVNMTYHSDGRRGLQHYVRVGCLLPNENDDYIYDGSYESDGFYRDDDADDVLYCPMHRTSHIDYEYEYEGMVAYWPETETGQTATIPCEAEMGLIGNQTRYCDENGIWDDPNQVGCVSEEFLMLADMADEGGELEPNLEIAAHTTSHLETLTLTPMVAGDLNIAVKTLNKLSDIWKEEETWVVTETEVSELIMTADNVLAPDNEDSWKQLSRTGGNQALAMLESMEHVSEVLTRVELTESTKFGDSNVEMHVKPLHDDVTEDVYFPDPVLNSDTWQTSDVDGVHIPAAALQSIQQDYPESNIMLSSTRFKSLGEHFEMSSNVSSQIIAVNVENTDSSQNQKTLRLSENIELFFNAEEIHNDNNSTMECAFWDYSVTPSGGWSTSGCSMTHHNGSQIICECNHLTNFAILMSRHAIRGVHHKILGGITILGCTISMICLVVTVVVYLLLWKKIKSQSGLITVNLCIALLLGNFFFLVGIDQTQNKSVCQMMAVFIHYFFLVCFTLMAIQGVLVFIYLVIVFHTKKKNETIIIVGTAWGLPAALVFLTMAATHMDGYGTENFCWLSLENGAIWAFLVPVILVIAMNTVILIIAMKKVINRPTTKKQKESDQIKSTLWNIAVLLPILGITWLFGVFAMGESTLIFHYLFAISNSLQGAFIFLFHCVFNKRIRDQLKSEALQNSLTPTFITSFLSEKSTSSVQKTQSASQPSASEPSGSQPQQSKNHSSAPFRSQPLSSH